MEETTPTEPRLDEDLPVDDESAEQVTGGHWKGRDHTAHSAHSAHTAHTAHTA